MKKEKKNKKNQNTKKGKGNREKHQNSQKLLTELPNLTSDCSCYKLEGKLSGNDT